MVIRNVSRIPDFFTYSMNVILESMGCAVYDLNLIPEVDGLRGPFIGFMLKNVSTVLL